MGDKRTYGLLLASGDFPDILYLNGVQYAGGLEKAVEEGVILDLSDRLSQLPTYESLRHSNTEALKETLTDDGRTLGIYTLNGNDSELALEAAWAGMGIRKDLLDELGLSVPETIGEWHNVLCAFRDSSRVSIPLEFYQVEGQVHFGPLEKEYRQYVELLRDWYTEGLIDPNFVTNDASMITPFADYGAGKIGAGPTAWGFTTDILKTSFGLNEEEKFYIAGVLSPVINKGDKPASGFNGSTYAAYPFCISNTCKNVDLALSWLDFQFSREAMEINNYGVEGQTYMKNNDGSYSYTEYISADPDYSFVDKLYMATWGNTNFGRYTWEKYDAVYEESLRECQAIWQAEDMSMALPNISMTDEEGTRYNSLYTAVDTLVQERTVKYIMGSESMDTYDAFVEQIKSHGAEECIEIYQKALNRYNARK